MIALALQAAQPAVAPLAFNDGTQLSCTAVMPTGAAPVMFDLDFRSKKRTNVVIAMAGDAFRVSATSVATRRADGVTAIGFATGSGQYRLELMPQGAAARLRLLSIDGADVRLAGQGWCGPRGGRALRTPPQVPTPLDGTAQASPAWKLGPMPATLFTGQCRLVGPDRQVHQLSYRWTQSRGNEFGAAYTFDTPTLLGAAQPFGTGTQFALVAPTERMIATTASLGGATPVYLHITFERSGSFVDISRGGQLLAVGECGSPPASLVAPGASQ